MQPLVAQTGDISAPVMGLLPTRGALRTLAGVPGAATVGAPVTVPLEFSGAAVSPAQDCALLVARDDGRVMRVTASGEAVAVDGAAADPARIVWSANGGAAGLDYGDTLQIVAGTAVTRTIGLTGLGDTVTLAVMDDGRALAAAGGSLYLLEQDAARPVAQVGEVTALAAAGGDAVAARAGQVMIVRDVAGAAEARVLPGGEDVVRPVAMALVNGRVLVADGEKAEVTVLDVAGGKATAACSCAVAGLERLGSSLLFRITAADDRPVWLLDAGGAEPRLWFVPESPEVRQ